MILLLDIDDTLLDFKKSEHFALSAVLDKYNIPKTKENYELYSKINLSYWKMFEKNLISRPELLNRRFQDYFKILNIDIDDPEKVNKCYFSYLKEGGYLFDDSLEFLDECKEKGIRLFACSNGDKNVQKSRIRLANIEKYFEYIFVSEEIGLSKPNKEYFDYVLSFIGETSESIYMLGDSLTSDIQGGKNASICTIWLNKKGEVSNLPDYTIRNLKEFFDLNLR